MWCSGSSNSLLNTATGGALTGFDVALMLRSEQKIVNSSTAILFDNRTQN
jgi:hypothetical protein